MFGVRPYLRHPRITRGGETLLARIRVQWHPLLRSLEHQTRGHWPKCACGRTVNLRHLLRECPLTRAARTLILPAATPLHDLCIRHEVSVLKFLVFADLVPGPETLYVVPRASAAAVPTVLVAAAVAAAIADPVSEAGVTTRV